MWILIWGLFSIAVCLLSARMGYFHLPETTPSKVKWLQTFSVFVIYFGVTFGFGPLLWNYFPGSQWFQWGVLTAAALSCLGYTYLNAPQLLKFRWRAFGLGVCSIAIVWPLRQFFGELISRFTEHFFTTFEEQQWIFDLLGKLPPSLLAATSISIVITVPFIEELLFRGFLQSSLKRILPFWAALLIASLVFTAVHYSPSQGLANAEILGCVFVLSLFLGYVFEKTKSLAASWGLHMTFNLIGLIAYFFETP